MNADSMLNIARGLFTASLLPSQWQRIPFQDSLSVGPCSDVVSEHVSLRKQYYLDQRHSKWFGSRPYSDASALSQVLEEAGRKELAIWISKDLDDYLLLFWLLCALLCEQREFKGVSLVQMPFPKDDVHLAAKGVVDLASQQLQLSSEQILMGSKIWSCYVNGDIKSISDIASRTDGDSVCISMFFEACKLMLPRVLRNIPALSIIDEVILQGFDSKKPRSPIDICEHIGGIYPEIPRSWLLQRVRDWIDSQSELFVRRTRNARMQRWYSDEFCLSDQGLQFRNRDTVSLLKVPTTKLGGVVLYDSVSCWVIDDNGEPMLMQQ